MLVSVSQVEKYLECPRKWALERIYRLREPGQRYGMIFGNVLHGVLERWLKADDTGRDPSTGKAVDLYPPGWQWDMQAGRRIEARHDDLIPNLVQQAIDKGILTREKGRTVEEEFWGVVQEDPFVVITGRVDGQWPGTIIDHKSTKNERYADSKHQLWNDLQGNIYARRMFQKHDALKVVQFHHHYYDWSAGKVFVRTAQRPPKRGPSPGISKFTGLPILGPVIETYEPGITRAQAEKVWAKFEKASAEMAQIKLAQADKREPFKIACAMEGAGAGPSACSAFGGCGYVDICRKGTAEAFESVRKRLLVLSLPREVQGQLEIDMAKKSVLKKKLAEKQTAAAPKKSGNPFVEAAEEAEAEEETEVEETPAPVVKKKVAAKAVAKKPAPPVEEVEEEVEEATEEEEEAPEEEEAEEEEPETEEEEEETPSVDASILKVNAALLEKVKPADLRKNLLGAFSAGLEGLEAPALRKVTLAMFASLKGLGGK